MIEHPDKYSPQQIEESLSDDETREIYNLLCKTQSSLAGNNDTANVDTEWHTFARKHMKPRLRFFFSGSRAASISALALTSIAALAIGSAITISLKTSQHIATAPEQQHAIETVAVAHKTQSPAPTEPDTIKPAPAPQLFEDESLETILNAIAARYNANVTYKNAETAQLHLFYKFDPAMTLDETVEQLNSFDQISIRLSGNTLTVD